MSESDFITDDNVNPFRMVQRETRSCVGLHMINNHATPVE